jgi:hypothetical protein
VPARVPWVRIPPLPPIYYWIGIDWLVDMNSADPKSNQQRKVAQG